MGSFKLFDFCTSLKETGLRTAAAFFEKKNEKK